MKIKLLTLGCPKNLVDSEVLIGGLSAGSVEFVEPEANAEVVIINTCGFIEAAKKESIDCILDAVKQKQAGECSRVIVTGCLSQRYGAALKKEIPELDGIYGNTDLKNIINSIKTQLALKENLIGERITQTPAHYAYLKISEGCEHPCTFCAIPGIRGGFKSRSIESLVSETRGLVASGVKEVILIAQDSTAYGLDLYGSKELPRLLKNLASIDGLHWVRLMYAYPWHITDSLIETIATTDKVCNYIDMPVQHVNSWLLKRMARRMNGERQHQVIEKLKKNIPDLALRTSVIVGFPGETDVAFDELYNYVSSGTFSHLGVFTYSNEEGTPAATFPEQVPPETMRQRQDMLIQAQEACCEERSQDLHGQVVKVLMDAQDPAAGCFTGRTEKDCPEVDNTVSTTDLCQPGSFYDIEITGYLAGNLSGRIVRPDRSEEGQSVVTANLI